MLQRPMHRMGELVTEQLQIEVKAKVLQNARFKYACRTLRPHRDHHAIVIAPMPRSSCRQYRHGLDTGVRARSQICRRHAALSPGAGLRAGRGSVSVAHWATG